ncbi:hypothetical protein [Dyella sp.]|uniref:hypothetical protein n=1 Tax=Dyella sp. TaxID=1869338 RepID=UPI00284DDBA7|nr:hypothetical protein [Dyella sp.]MDR3446617.1 hypothetical protein [Dyella sp.]
MNLFRYVAPLGAVLLAACSTFSVSNQWKDPSWPGPPAGNVLVMGITKSDTYRHVFEDTFAQQLQAAGVQAEQSYSQIPAGAASEKLTDVIKATGAQVILTTRVQRVEQKLNVTPSGPGFGGFYGWYGGAWASAPDVTQYDAVTLETTVWDVSSQKVIWSVTTEGVGTSNIPQATQDLAKTIIPKLKSDGIIR